MRPLAPRLNERILELAPRFTLSDRAPNTFPELCAQAAGSLVVWPGASERTIYGCPRVNWAFRAWHDLIHLQLGADFTLEGEVRVAKEQARLLGDRLGELVLAEVKGQAEYYQRHGYFPVDQVSFIQNYLRGII